MRVEYYVIWPGGYTAVLNLEQAVTLLKELIDMGKTKVTIEKRELR